MKKIYISNLYFNQWLAGFIDGNGHFRTKPNAPKLRIVGPKDDLEAISYIQKKLGGSVKLRKKGKSLVFNIGKKERITKLIHRINGEIRNSVRIVQLKEVCSIYGIPYKISRFLIKDTAWYSGFFDAGGCISAEFRRSSPRLIFSVSNKLIMNLRDFLIFKGKIYYNEKKNFKWYVWKISKDEDILAIYKYFKKYPLLSHKSRRLALIEKFYELKSIQAHKIDPASEKGKAWEILKSKWKYDSK